MGLNKFDYSLPVNAANLAELKLQVPNCQHFEREVARWLREDAARVDREPKTGSSAFEVEEAVKEEHEPESHGPEASEISN